MKNEYYGWVYINPETGLCIKKSPQRHNRSYDMQPLSYFLEDGMSEDEITEVTQAWWRRVYCTRNFTRGIFSNPANHRLWEKIEERTGLKFYLRPIKAEILDDAAIVIQMAREQRKNSFERDIFWTKFKKVGKPLMRSSRTARYYQKQKESRQDARDLSKEFTSFIREKRKASNKKTHE